MWVKFPWHHKKKGHTDHPEQLTAKWTIGWRRMMQIVCCQSTYKGIDVSSLWAVWCCHHHKAQCTWILGCVTTVKKKKIDNSKQTKTTTKITHLCTFHLFQRQSSTNIFKSGTNTFNKTSLEMTHSPYKYSSWMMHRFFLCGPEDGTTICSQWLGRTQERREGALQLLITHVVGEKKNGFVLSEIKSSRRLRWVETMTVASLRRN